MLSAALARAAALATLMVIAGGCGAGTLPGGSDRLLGESRALGGGSVYSWVRVNGEGHPSALGMSLDEDALAALVPDSAVTLRLRMPEAVPPFDHVELRWGPRGHEPTGVYDVPHLDVHFYLVPPAERETLTDSALAARVPALEHVPASYIPVPGLLPLAGNRWMDVTAAEYAGAPFTHALLYGFYDARMVFIEPSVAPGFLQSRPDEVREIKLPRQYAVPGYYPTRYRVRYDASPREYSIALEGLVRRP